MSTPPVSSIAAHCPHRAQACAAVGALVAGAGEIAPEGAQWLARIAPCGHCRVAFDASRARLRHLRLGQRERAILLGAAGLLGAAAAGAAGSFSVTAAGDSRAASAAARRAAGSLARAGLVAMAERGPDEPRAAVRLTALGRYVIAAYGRYLSSGRPVRWTRPAANALIPARDPALLVPEALEAARGELTATLVDLKRTLLAAITRPGLDRERLAVVTGQLEARAKALRAVLEAPAAAAHARRDAG